MNIPATPEVLEGLDHWRKLNPAQQPNWPDQQALRDSYDTLAQLPPLVFAGEADLLKRRLAKAVTGEAFVLQGGDCAETFAELSADNIRNKIKTLLQMAVVLTYGASTPIIKMGRMAGQYAKPRSSDLEVKDGISLPSYRGDMVNSFEFTEEARIPDPKRMERVYNLSASTLNLIRAFTTGGFADLRLVHDWNRGFVANPAYAKYNKLADEIDRAIRFMAATGTDFDAIKAVEFFAGHEALVLEYERALTRIDSRSGLPYACSAHFLWIGERTRDIDGAHVDFLARVQNPIGIKLGPTTTPEQAVELVQKLNPQGEPGRLSLITRMGAGVIDDVLPDIIRAVTETEIPVVWITDPMHGNTITSSNGYKTRRFKDVLSEVQSFFKIHEQLGSVAGGLHVELTGDDVTEVLGGSEEIDDEGLAKRYQTLVDPRLNHQQSLEMAFQVVDMLRAND